ncbi:DUF4180 domain-containing protein [Pseudonocardia sp. KRD291]|uniref:DUF4180 domain-containing protein n=1 Tax=Pseudonocardia sp. KRD291 TaxID=2792007 RepID=UPI001C4A18E7|nr:DUF4180 domain-containing protein [Pseudonocardia sp. KRD291]MBW0103903.1 DUF4180 domain-containing protein [Pseudonocardia sp. KRD291]
MTAPHVHTVPADGPPVAGEQDALDLIGDAFGAGADAVVLPVERLAPEFFRLRTGVAGAVVQKFVNYRVRLIIIGDVSAHVEAGGPLADWIRETGYGRDVWFVADRAELDRRLAATG